MAIFSLYVFGSSNVAAVPEQPISTSSLVKKVFGKSRFHVLRQQSYLCPGN
jgi:hypothetical protein